MPNLKTPLVVLGPGILLALGPLPMKARPDYLPTPRQIALECAEIRRQWTPAELRRRTVGYALRIQQSMWFPPTIDTATCTSRVRRIACEQSA